MSSLEAGLVTLAILAGIGALAYGLLRGVDRLRKRPARGTPGLQVTSKQKAILGGMLAAVLLFAATTLLTAQPLMVSVPLAFGAAVVMMVAFGRGRRKGVAHLERLADRFGWRPGFYRRKAFSVLPEEDVVREWNGRRVGLRLGDPQQGDHETPGFIEITVALELPGTMRIHRATSSSARGSDPLSGLAATGTPPELLARVSTNPELPVLLQATLLLPEDRVEASSGRLRVRLILNGRPTDRGILSYSPWSPDPEVLTAPVTQAWTVAQRLVAVLASATPHRA